MNIVSVKECLKMLNNYSVEPIAANKLFTILMYN